MDSVKFLEERKRMFKNGNPVPGLDIDITYNTEKVVKIVEAWSAAHPRKTRQSVFLEQYPDTERDRSGVIQICPRIISATHRDSGGQCKTPEMVCMDCIREFWMQEVE